MNVKMAAKSLVTALLLTVGSASFAGTVYVGANETVEKTVTSGSETESDAYFADTDMGWYEKLGTGSLLLPQANVLSPAPLKVALMNGSLRLTKGTSPAASRPTVADAPAVIREKAAFWVDSRTNLAYADESSGTVAQWYDVRETAADIAAGTTKYPSARAVKLWDESIVYPHLSENEADGNKYVNFNGVHASTAMKFCCPGETSSPTATIRSVRHLFIAHRMTTGQGFFWGRNSGDIYFCPGNYKGEFGPYLGAAYNNNGWYGTLQGCFRRDGVWIDPVTTRSSARTEVLEYSAHPKQTVQIGNFGCEGPRYTKNYEYRCGCDDIGENIVFACALTEEERLAVTRYLMARWRSSVAAGNVAVTAAQGTAIEVTGDADEVPPGAYPLTGDATLLKTGSGEAAAQRLYATKGLSDRVRVEGGTLRYETASVGPQLSAGEKVSATKDQWETLALSGTTAEAGAVEFDVPADLTLPEIPADTEKIVVTNGRLALGNKSAAAADLPQAGEVRAYIPNPGFEDGANNWVSVKPSNLGNYNPSLTVVNYASEDYISKSGNWRAPYWDGSDTVHYGAPEGTRVMMMRYSPFLLYSPIDFPQAGVYDLSFAAAMRADYSYTPAATDLLLFREGETNVIARMKTYYNLGRYQRFTFRLPRVEAGRYYFGFQNTTSYSERNEQHLHVDDFKATLVVDAGAGEVPVPNGTFERETYPNKTSTSDLFGFKTSYLGETGWTFENGVFGADSAANPDVGVCSSLTPDGLYATRMPGGGDRQLVFCGTGGVATSDPFSVPAGTYTLRFDAARTSRTTFTYNGVSPKRSENAQQDPIFQVEVFVNGDATAAATYTTGKITSLDPLQFEGTATFDVAATDTVVLRIRQTNPDGVQDSANNIYFTSCGAIDNLRLVKAGVGNLVRNASFETSDDWNFVICPDENSDRSYAGRMKYADGAKYYGSAVCDGEWYVRITQWSYASQTITVPQAGWYKLSCWTRSRVDAVNDPQKLTYAYGGNQLRAWWCDESGEQTNEFYRTACIYSTNFLEHTAYVKLPAGRLVLGLQGVNRKGVEQVSPGTAIDANIILDAVSLTAVEAPIAPAELTGKAVTISKDAKLRLDFEGQVQLESFGYGNGHRSGVINAERFPEFISGEGSFYVEPKGLLLIVK